MKSNVDEQKKKRFEFKCHFQVTNHKSKHKISRKKMAAKLEKHCTNEQLDILQNELEEMKAKLMLLNVKSAILNINFVSIHDPKMKKKITKDAKICNKCFEKCEQRSKDNEQQIQPEYDQEYNGMAAKIKLIIKDPEE